MLLAIGVAGQLAWLAYALGGVGVHLADAIAIEGLVVAVVVGGLGLREALEHEEHLRTVSGDLTGISNNLNEVQRVVLTRPLGGFPVFFKHVSLLLERAGDGVRIMCDKPAYAVVSDSEAFGDYLAELTKCIGRRHRDPDFTVELMFLDAAEREELHLDQVHRALEEKGGTSSPEADRWAHWRDDNRHQLEGFLNSTHGLRHPGDPSPREAVKAQNRTTVDTLSLLEYVQHVKAVNAAVLGRELSSAQPRVLRFRDEDGTTRARTGGPSIYFWMRDDTEAIFVIVPLGGPGQGREVAFSTVDPTMITALNGVYRRYAAASISAEEAARSMPSVSAQAASGSH